MPIEYKCLNAALVKFSVSDEEFAKALQDPQDYSPSIGCQLDPGQLFALRHCLSHIPRNIPDKDLKFRQLATCLQGFYPDL